MMKHLLFATALIAMTSPVFAADVGVSVSVGQPGFYGRIDIGNEPPPRVIYREPIVIERAPVEVVREPVYLRVPPGHAKNWRKYCHHYDACGQKVYFVQDSWYNKEYVPRHQHDHDRDGRDDRRHEEDHHDRGPDRDHDRGHRDDRDHGRR